LRLYSGLHYIYQLSFFELEFKNWMISCQ
jgi:hypothetical protein